MKKKLIASILFVFLSFSAFSINFFTDDVEHKATVYLQAANYHDLFTYTLGVGSIIQADMKEIKADTGFVISYEGVNLTVQGIYAPTVKEIFNPGVILINHFDWDYNDFFEFDFLTGFYLEARPSNKWIFNTTLLYHRKVSAIYAVYKDIKSLISNGMAFELSTTHIPKDGITVNFTLASYNFFRYFLSFSPDFRLSAEFKVNDYLFLGANLEAQFVDFFTLSANCSSIGGGVSIGWRF